MILDPARAFLGVGWSFPVAPNAADISTAAYQEDIRQSILIILQTNYNERVMRPDFGAGLRDFIFEPVTSNTLAQVQRRVQQSLVDWEPRIDVVSVDVTTGTSLSQLLVDIDYRVRATNTKQNLVYPFYLAEGPGTEASS